MNRQAQLIRFWAIKHPRPSKFRVTCGSEKQLVEMGPRTAWARVAETLEAMEPDLIEALGPNDNIIRACRPAELADSSEADEEERDNENASEQARPIAAYDGETARFQLFSQLLSKAYVDAQAQVGLRNDQVFNRMLDLFETIADQSKNQAHAMDVQQKTINKLYEEQIKQAFARAQSGGGDGAERTWIDDLVEPLMKAYQRAQGGDEPEVDDEPEVEVPTPNGKGPH